METVRQIICPSCRELNLPYLAECAYCHAPLPPAPLPAKPAPPPPPDAPSDLPPLLWSLVCFFVAVWGLAAAGPLRGLARVLTHPYLLGAAGAAAVVLTGIFLAERASRQPVPRALVSSRDLMALSWTAAALLGASQLLRYVLPAAPVISRYQIVESDEPGCRAEVFVKGEEGDELWRLTGLNRKSEKEIVGVILRRAGGVSDRLPLTERTSRGDCAIVKYHLMVNGKDVDQIDGAAP